MSRGVGRASADKRVDPLPTTKITPPQSKISQNAQLLLLYRILHKSRLLLKMADFSKFVSFVFDSFETSTPPTKHIDPIHDKVHTPTCGGVGVPQALDSLLNRNSDKGTL